MKRKLAVIGNGMLGSELAAMAAANGWELSVYDLPEFDLTNREQLRQAVNSADCVVNCAAYTNVDKAESEKDLCMAVNARALSPLGELAAAADKYVVHISTDFVFGDIQDTPQTETDQPRPLNVYGTSKLAGEQNLLNSGCACAVIRVQWTYGRNGNNFISKILELARKLPRLKVVDDQYGSPTWTGDIAYAIMDFLNNKYQGLYHFAASGFTSRFDVAGEIIRHFGLKTELTPCKSTDFQTPAARPHNSRFDCSKIDRILSFRRPDWRQSLQEFLNKLS